MYYTGKYQPRVEVEAPAEPEVQPTSTVQSLAGMLPLRYVTGGGSGETEPPANASQDESPVTPQAPTYTVPKARTAFSAFVDHPKEFIDFLETLVQQPDLKKGTKIDLFTTLFEMYLDTAKRKKDATERLEWENKAKKLIEGKDVSTVSSTVL